MDAGFLLRVGYLCSSWIKIGPPSSRSGELPHYLPSKTEESRDQIPTSGAGWHETADDIDFPIREAPFQPNPVLIAAADLPKPCVPRRVDDQASLLGRSHRR